MIIELLKSDERLNLKKGYRYNAKTYPIDPEKVTLINRVTKKGKHLKKNIFLNEYKCNIKIIQ